ncbi:hypothetical protein FRC10_006035 [Ceratobasidium sp. 414]|nr:hypothetical protein FRC10_006035 [Ceratobasidium sp. 414]
MTGLVYLRLSGRLSLEDGKLVWKTSGQSRGLNCLTSSGAAHDTSPSFHASESGSNAGRTPADPTRQVVAVRPRVHISTQQVTVLEDAQGVQMVHLHELSNVTRPDDQDGASEKVDLEGDGSFKLKQRMPDAEGDVGTPTVGVRFLTTQ